MTIGKEIRVVLSLDDAGFSVKTNTARQAVKNLETGLSGLSKSANQVEGSIQTLSIDLKGFADGFARVQKSLQATADKLQGQVAGSFAQVGKGAKQSTKDVQDAATAQIDAKMRTLRTELDANKKLLESRAKLHADLRKAEAEANGRAIAARVAADNVIKRDKNGRGLVEPGDGAKINALRAEAKLHDHNATVIGLEAIKTSEWINTARQAQAQRVSNIATLESDRRARQSLAAVEAAVAKSNAAEIKRVREQAAEAQKESQRAATNAAQATTRAKKTAADQEVRDRRNAEEQMRREARETAAVMRREARETAAEQRREANAIAQMWRGMAAAYSGAKVGQGLRASVNQADQLEREKVIVSALNLPEGEEKQFYASAEAMTQNMKFLSTLDAIQSRMSAIASIGYNNVDVINKTLETAVKASNNLQVLGLAHGDMQSTIRNLYGVVEMRQQVADTDATNRTFEVMQKIITGTAGKVQTQDMETVLRRLGMGASQLSDKGLINLAAVVDQFKVAGGDGGGSGGGVSTVGTAFKMMQAYSLGKGLSNTAVKEFAGAGVLADSGIDLSKDSAGILRDAKHGGFKDADLWLKDPVGAVQKIFPKILDYTQSEKQRNKYYQGRDVNDVENQMVAVSMYLARLGITTTASQAMMVAGDPRSKARIQHQAHTIEGSKGVSELDAKLAETYASDVQEVKTSLKEIGQIVGTTLLPPLKAFLSVVGELLKSTREFAKDNPMLTQLTAIAAAFGGLYLSVRGAMMLFGTTGSIMRTFTSVLTGTGAAAAASGAAAATSGGLWKIMASSVGGSLGGLKTAWTTYSATMARNMALGGLAVRTGSLGIRTSFTLMGASIRATAALIGRSFMRMLPLVGQLVLAWDLAQIVAGFKIGGARVDSWLISWGDRLYVWAQNAWTRVKAAFKDGAGKAQAEAEIAQRNMELKQRLTANGTLTDSEKPKEPEKKPETPDDKARREQLEAADAALKAQQAQGAVVAGQNNAQKIIDAANGAGRREDRDPLGAAIGEAGGKVEAQKEKLKALVDGVETLESLRKQADALIESKRKGDELSPNRLASKRPGAADPRIVELKDRTFQEMLLGEQIKALSFANERVTASTYEADAAMERLTGNGVEKQTDAFRALSRELERTEVRIGAGAQQFGRWAAAKNEALFGQARSDAANFAAGYMDKNPEDATKLIANERDRVAEELRIAAAAEDRKYELHVKTLEKTRAATVASLLAEGPPTVAARAKIEKINADALATREELEERYAERRSIRAEEEVRAMESAVAKMTREWKDYGKAIDDIGVNAANSFVSMLTSTLGTGRMQVGDFVKGVLLDIANAKLKAQLADPMTEGLEKGGAWLTSKLFGGAGAGAQAGIGGRAEELERLGQEAGLTGDALKNFATDGLAKAVASTAMETSASAKTAATFELLSLSATKLATTLELAAMGAGGEAGGVGSFMRGFAGDFDFGSLLPAGSTVPQSQFANGGIMTNFGPVELRKYAKGGIANSPQLALYGEAGPEAYVPLPDGRSIPVTMSGGQGAAPSVQVNVINQTSQQVNAQQGGMRFDGKQFILDVVMTAASSPGPFRQNMKEAMK